MAQEEIEIEISSDGKVTIRTIGIKGSKCLDKASEIAQIVGREESRTMTHELYETPGEVHNRIDIRRS